MGYNCQYLPFIYYLFVVSLIFSGDTHALESDFRGQLSGWTIESRNQDRWENNTGLRYIPQLNLTHSLDEDAFIDTEISINGFLTNDENSDGKHGDIDIYRLWIRYASPQFEIRAGLQKINFGSAVLLRPLMWFDRMDPRDPLQLTEGVYGLLGRYYFLNNANVWIWGLLGNDETKGWENFPSEKDSVEFGGRVQFPLYDGEIAFSYHHREVDLQNQIFPALLSSEGSIPENRFGLDGKWDVGIGLWFEGALIHQNLDISSLRYKRLINVGMDYTFDLGDGLNVIGEYFSIGTSENVFDSGEEISFSAVSVSYPLGLLDNITAMIYYNWDNQDWYRFLQWQRKYDNWSIYLMGFWNPDEFQIYQNRQGNSPFAGKGLQLMIVFNH
ncbi:MAG: hypothetical protein ABIN18_22740 [Pseudomonadota bacterium]